MANSAVTRETIAFLRQSIAKIEGVLPERLEAAAVATGGDNGGGVILREAGLAVKSRFSGMFKTGVERFDAALGGGLPQAALTEIHCPDTRDAGAMAGFALGMASLARSRSAGGPVFWIGAGQAFSEAGFPYAPGLGAFYGLTQADVLIANTGRLADALWIAEEAARLNALSSVFLEIRGNPHLLDLTATRRLHRRARIACHPVFILRQSSQAQSSQAQSSQATPSAAPLRLIVRAAAAAPRRAAAASSSASVARPAYAVTIDKSRFGSAGQFLLEWNPHEHAFQERQSEDPGFMVPVSQRRPDIAPASGAILALGPAEAEAATHFQPSREQHATHRRPRRAG